MALDCFFVTFCPFKVKTVNWKEGRNHLKLSFRRSLRGAADIYKLTYQRLSTSFSPTIGIKGEINQIDDLSLTFFIFRHR